VNRISPIRADLRAPAPADDALPSSLLYAASTALGGPGLPTTSFETARASFERGFLGAVVCKENAQHTIPPHKFRSILGHPAMWTRPFLSREREEGLRKILTARIAASRLRSGKFDAFHSWSGDCLEALITAHRLGIPSLLEIPTWHRNKGKTKSFMTAEDREVDFSFRHRLTIPRQHTLMEYELADVILIPSTRSAESFIDSGIPAEKLFLIGRGVDIEKFTPSTPPKDVFRLAFLGALIKRKGIHHLLKAWSDLKLANAELLLIGNVEPEIQPYLEKFANDSIVVTGFVSNPQDYLAKSSAFVFPSELEGAAKATFEASACALPLISTREAGDAVVDGTTGINIPPNDPEALKSAILKLYNHPENARKMGLTGREYIRDNFTWNHHRQKLLHAYAYAREVVHQRSMPQQSAS